jgi:hypothetical protein
VLDDIVAHQMAAAATAMKENGEQSDEAKAGVESAAAAWTARLTSVLPDGDEARARFEAWQAVLPDAFKDVATPKNLQKVCNTQQISTVKQLLHLLREVFRSMSRFSNAIGRECCVWHLVSWTT